MKAKLLQALAAATATLLACVPATRAHAHAPSPAAADFAPRYGAMVTVDAAFADAFLVPGVAFEHGRSSGRDADGREAALDPVQVLKTRGVAEHRLSRPGTTGAVSTAERTPAAIPLLTGAPGRATFNLVRAGRYLALVPRRSAAPAGEYSHSDTRGFRVLAQ